MGLSSALTTALTGLTAAEAQIDVVGNNLANSQTVGFKSSEAVFATQFLQTQSLGSQPTATTGGTNPRQIGLGTQVAEISPDFTQGTIEISSNPSDLAIQGDGFFVVEGASGGQVYTRNGIFNTNAQNELVTVNGERLLGFGIDDDFEIQRTQLVPLSIPLGSAAVAQATENVFLEGTLTPTGDIADAAEVIESAVLGDAVVERPNLIGDTNGDGVADVSPVGIAVVGPPTITSSTNYIATEPTIAGFGVTHNDAAGGTIAEGSSFIYRVTFSDTGAARTNETLPSANSPGVTVPVGDGAANNTIDLTGLPTSTAYAQINIYRSSDGGANFFFLKSEAMSATVTDDTAAISDDPLQPNIGGLGVAHNDAAGGTIPEGVTYNYRVTFSNASRANETLASNQSISVTVPAGDGVANNTIDLTGISTSTSYTDTNLYRSSDGGATYFLVKSVAMSAAITDDSGTPTTTELDVRQLITTGTGGAHTGGDTFSYRIVHVDSSGTETEGSDPITVTITGASGDGNAKSVVLDNLPTGTDYVSTRIYRSDDGGVSYFLLDTVAMTDTYIDTDAIALSTTPLDTTTINGNYTYLVTFQSTAGDAESRPSLSIGPRNAINSRIQLTNLPIPDSTLPPPYDRIRIYRNLANDASTYYLVDTVLPGADYTDSKTDAEISDLTISGNKVIDLDGPKVDSNTLLVNLVSRDELTYTNQFQLGTLDFTGRKGGRLLKTQEFQITATSTVRDLLDFMEDSMGIRNATSDTTNTIPGSVNNIPSESGTLATGGSVTNGKIRFVSNNGEDNALRVSLSAFDLDPGTGTTTTPVLGFGTIQEAVGQSATTDFVVFDSLGIPLEVRLTAVLESRTGTTTTYRWFADSEDNDPISGVDISVGTGLVSFDGEGNLLNVSNSTVSIDRRNIPSSSPLEFDLDFSQVSGLANTESSIAASRQDGSSTGKLISFIINEDGVVRGVFSSGITRDLGEIRLARFANPGGLEQLGRNLFASGVNSGLAILGAPGQEGIGSLIAGAVELSNTDIGQNLIDLVLATTQYRGNARVITAAQQLLDELLNLRR